jgi:hypothetical protein
MSQVPLELLRNREVVDREGRRVGRIEELLAEEVDGECRILEYHLGRYGLLESIGALGGALARLIHRSAHEGYAVRWDRMDLTDPARPRLTCTREELPRL